MLEFSAPNIRAIQLESNEIRFTLTIYDLLRYPTLPLLAIGVFAAGLHRRPASRSMTKP